ncbi:hypothetical protein GIB67_039430 [Kingdonia uniflora]|uniref:Beta-glucosidase n=1 Tax=Kingdonia uniflora TaxID=39325 RepID=A0A7J7LII1_9MAGN|nr:hypothetical protein GIB67_039430 [Kingdonia uniflora]
MPKRENWDGVPPGELPIDSSGLQGVLESIKQLYGNPPIYIHENGQRTLHNASLNDTSRVQYLNTSLACILHSMRNGSDVRGYFTWSFLDVFELTDGYKSSYGLYYVDFKDPDLKRYPKLSAHWYSTFLKERRNNVNGVIELKNKSGYSQSSHFA